MTRPTFYRNAATVAAYHAAAPDYIRTGRALCGADIRRPAFWDEFPEPDPIPAFGAAGHRVCGHCRRIIARQEQTP